MSIEAPPAPAPAETPVASAVPVSDLPVHPGNVGLPRDPTTGKFLPKDAAPAPAPEKPQVEEVKAAPPESKPEPLGDRFAILAKKERALVQRDQELKARIADIEKREAALKSGVVPTQEFKEKPLQALAKQLGVDIKTAYDLVTQQALNGFDDPATPAEQAARLAREEVENLRAELRKERETELERAKSQAKAEEARTLQQFRQECHDFLGANKDKYELTAHFANGDELYNLVDEHWRQQVASVPPAQRRVLQLDEAAQLLEEHFEKQVETGLKLKKVSAKVQPAPNPAPTQRITPSEKPPALSNKLASSAGTTPSDEPAPWDREARLKRAEAAFEAHRSK